MLVTTTTIGIDGLCGSGATIIADPDATSGAWGVKRMTGGYATIGRREDMEECDAVVVDVIEADGSIVDAAILCS